MSVSKKLLRHAIEITYRCVFIFESVINFSMELSTGLGDMIRCIGRCVFVSTCCVVKHRRIEVVSLGATCEKRYKVHAR